MFRGEDVKIKARHQQAIYAAQISHHESGTGVCEYVSVQERGSRIVRILLHRWIKSHRIASHSQLAG